MCLKIGCIKICCGFVSDLAKPTLMVCVCRVSCCHPSSSYRTVATPEPESLSHPIPTSRRTTGGKVHWRNIKIGFNVRRWNFPHWKMEKYIEDTNWFQRQKMEFLPAAKKACPHCSFIISSQNPSLQRISWSTPSKKIDNERMSVLHQNSAERHRREARRQKCTPWEVFASRRSN